MREHDAMRSRESRITNHGPRHWRHLLTALGVIGATVALHEGAHALVTARAGGKVKEIGIGFGPPLFRLRVRHLPVVVRMLPLGGYAAVDPEQIPPRRRIPMLLAGPLANIAAGLPLMLAFRRYPVEMPTDGRRVSLSGFAGTLAALIRAAAQGPGSIARLAGSMNVGLGLANLLPVYPLDGGHVVMSILEERGVPRETRIRFARWTAALFIMLARAAMLGDLRRLAGKEPGDQGTRGPDNT